MDGLPVTIRLIDPPLHEFLPDLTDLSVEVALAEERGDAGRARPRAARPTSAGSTSRTRCSGCAASGSASRSPGCSGCRPARSSRPPPTASRPAATRCPEIMIPLVASVRELDVVKSDILEVAEEVQGEPRPERSTFKIGTMIELAARRVPRRPDRRLRRLLLLRHQRPDPDGVGLLPRRRRGGVLLPLLRPRHLRRLPVRVAGPARASAAGARWARQGPRRPGPTSPRRLRRARRRPALDPLLRRGRARLRVLLAVPGAGGPARGRAGQS